MERCSGGCGAKVWADNSVVANDLADPVKEHVIRKLQCDGAQRFCFKCVKKTAFEWGFPRSDDSSVRRKRGVCAVENFSCDSHGRELLRPLPVSVRDIPVDGDKLMTTFGILPYAPDRCLCEKHYRTIRKYLLTNVRESALDHSPPSKRTRRPAAAAAEQDEKCPCVVCVNIRAALPRLGFGDRHKVLLACCGTQKTKVARCLGVDRNAIARRVHLRTLWMGTGYDKWRRKLRADSAAESGVLAELEDFWHSNPAVRVSECGRAVILRDKDATTTVSHPRYYCDKTYKDLYADWCKIHGENIHYSTFVRMRPFWVKPQPNNPRCGCTHHAQMEYVLKALCTWRAARHKRCDCDCSYCVPTATRLGHVKWTINTITEEVLCPFVGESAHPKCALGLCDECGADQLAICPDEEEAEGTITFTRFEDVKKGLLKVHEPTPHTLSVADFFAMLKVQIQLYAEHHFVAQWQTAQKIALLNNLPEQDRLVYIDFAANLVHQCYFEVQAQEFAKFQSSVLVIMVGQRQGDKNTFVTHFYCSDDRQHDFFYITTALADLLPSLAGARRVHIFSDGTACQFKNRYLMNWISSFEERFHSCCQWNFFATCHGRGVWDAEGGRLKAKVAAENKRAVEPGDIPVKDAAGVARWAATELGEAWCGIAGELEGRIITRRVVHLLKATDIKRNTRTRKDVEGIKGMRSLYCVASCGKTGTVEYAKLTCYCDRCINEDWDNCVSSDALGAWKTHAF
jgi:hypothetical protein